MEVFMDWNGSSYYNVQREMVTLDNVVFARGNAKRHPSEIVRVELSDLLQQRPEEAPISKHPSFLTRLFHYLLSARKNK